MNADQYAEYVERRMERLEKALSYSNRKYLLEIGPRKPSQVGTLFMKNIDKILKGEKPTPIYEGDH